MTEWFEHDGQSWPEHAHPEDVVEVKFPDGPAVFGGCTVMDWWSSEDRYNDWFRITHYRVITTEY